MPPPQRAKPARKSARCGVGEGSPRPKPPHPQPVGSGPRQHAPKDERCGEGARPTPDAPRQGQRRPPPGTLVQPPQRAEPARKSACCGVGDEFPCLHRPHPQAVGSGPRQHAPKDRRSGMGERPTRRPHTQARGTPPGALMPPRKRTKAARKSLRCGVGDGSPRPHQPHPQPVRSRLRPHAS